MRIARLCLKQRRKMPTRSEHGIQLKRRLRWEAGLTFFANDVSGCWTTKMPFLTWFSLIWLRNLRLILELRKRERSTVV